MSVYLDASALVALFVPDPLSARAHAAVLGQKEPLIVSDYAGLEFAASVRRFARAKVLAPRIAREALADFDSWVLAACSRVETEAKDIAGADAIVRREDTALRTSDAVHVAIALRAGAALLTFDKKLAGTARRLGVAVASTG